MNAPPAVSASPASPSLQDLLIRFDSLVSQMNAYAQHVEERLRSIETRLDFLEFNNSVLIGIPPPSAVPAPPASAVSAPPASAPPASAVSAPPASAVYAPPAVAGGVRAVKMCAFTKTYRRRPCMNPALENRDFCFYHKKYEGEQYLA